MATVSGNLNLTLPESFDKVDISVLSNNFMLLDIAFGQKLGKTEIANDVATTQEGKVLDARQGKALNDRIEKFEDAINIKTNSIDLNGKYIDNALFR